MHSVGEAVRVPGEHPPPPGGGGLGARAHSRSRTQTVSKWWVWGNMSSALMAAIR